MGCTQRAVLRSSTCGTLCLITSRHPHPSGSFASDLRCRRLSVARSGCRSILAVSTFFEFEVVPECSAVPAGTLAVLYSLEAAAAAAVGNCHRESDPEWDLGSKVDWD